MKNEDIKKELSELSQTLTHLPKVNRGEVPDGYFDQLPDNVLNKVTSTSSVSNQETSKVIPLSLKAMGIAASIAILLFVISSQKTTESAEAIPVDSMVEFIMDDIGELDEDFLFEVSNEMRDVAELDDETLNYMLEEEIDLIDDKILESIY